MLGAGTRPTSDLTRTQLLLWTGQRLRPDVPLYNMAACFTIEGDLDPDVFVRAWRSVVERSDALRTVFHDHDGVPSQEVLHRADVPVRQIDLTHDPRAQEAARAFVEAASREPLDPSRRPVDTALLRLGDRTWIWYLNQHHLITDAWATSCVFRRVSDAYARLEASAVPDDGAWPSFGACVEHESEFRASADFDRAEAHWTNQFGAHREPAPLYGVRVRNPTTRSVRVTCGLGADRSTFIRSFAGSQPIAAVTANLSVFNIFATALAAYVLRVTGDRSPTFGALSHNRSTAAHKDTIGVLIELLPMRVRAPAGATYGSLLDGVKSAAIDLLRYARPGTSAAHYHRQFNVVLNYVNATFPPFAGRRSTTEWIHPGHSDQLHALRLHVHDFDGTGEFVLHFDFNEDVFGPARRHEAIGHFLRLLDGFLDDPDQAVDDVDLLSEAERQRLLVDWNASSSPEPVRETIVSRFETQVERDGQREAVRMAGGAGGMSYRTLDRHATRLARRLHAVGADCSAPVATCMPPSEGSIVAILAALKAGAAFVPIDPSNPAGRIDRMLRDVGASALVVDPEASVDLPDFGGAILGWDQPDIEDGSADLPDVEPGDTAYIYFTSGSTGAPKGVRCAHLGLLNLLDAFEAMGPLPDRSKATWWTSVGFDVSAYEVFSSLLYGHTLHVVPLSMRANTAALVDYLAEASIQSAYIPPFALDALAEAWEAQPGAFDLRRVLVGVEPIPERLLARIQRQSSEVAIINGYGPTEATTCATLYRIGTSAPADRPAPIGRPVSNNRIYLLNERGRPQPAGVPGEIFIGGAGLAQGYLNRPAEEAERFVPDPFSGIGRLYRTGDLARLLPDDNLAFIGRIDNQLKVRGHRIEPEEVEHALNRQPDIATSVVTGDTGEGVVARAERLVAYVVPVSGSSIDPADLRQKLRVELPDYMVPSVFVSLDQMPRTPNGKVDRDALPRPGPEHAASRAAYVAAENETQEALCRIWSDVLDVDRIGIRDDFFELGGDSILAIQIVARARRHGLELTPTDLFDAPTVSALAGRAAAVRAVEEEPVSGRVCLSPAQCWLFEQNQPADAQFNQVVWAELPPELDEAAVAAAFARFVTHHAALRQSFHRDLDGRWHTVVHDAVPAPTLRVEDLTGLTDADRAARVAAVEGALNAGFDLAQPPLLAAAYFGDAGTDRLLLVAHHLVVDAVSWSVLLDDLRATELPHPTTSVGRWNEELADLGSAALPRERDYWAGVVATEVPELPRDLDEAGAGTVESEETVVVGTRRDHPIEVVDQAARSGRSTVHELLMTALALTLHGWTRSPDVRFFVEAHGRDTFEDLDVSHTVGWFTSLYPFAVRLPTDVDPATALGEMKDRLRAMPGHSADYGAFLYLDRQPRRREQYRLDQHDHLLFNYLGRADPLGAGGSRLRVSPLGLHRSPDVRRPFLLEVVARVVDGELRHEWTYSTRCHRPATVRTLAEAMRVHLGAVVEACLQGRVATTGSDFPLAGLDDRTLDRLAAVLDPEHP